MSESASDTLLQRAHEAASHGRWQQAFELFEEADAGDDLLMADLPTFADVAYAAGRLDVTIDAWERAHAGLLRAGDRVAAAGAAVRVALHLLFDTALMAPVRGWLTRAERLLDGQSETPVHAWLAIVRSYERMLSGDLGTASDWANRAIEVGAKFDPAALAIGQVASARLLILNGEVRSGLTLIEEAGVAAVSGELDALSTGVVYCELVCALQALAQYDLAEEWTDAMERWSQTNAIGSVHGRCRVHRAEILRLRGFLDDAEREVLAAVGELQPYLRREMGWPLNELGRIRLQKGDLKASEQAALSAQRAAWNPQPTLALVLLAQGDVAGATASIREALANPTPVPSKELPPNTELRRAPLLEAQVEIEVAAGNVDRARAAAIELEGIARRFESKALRASAAQSRGRVRLAEGDLGGAEQSSLDALRLWNEVGAPYEAAKARLGLAQALSATGNEQGATLQLEAAHTILDQSRAASPAPVSWLQGQHTSADLDRGVFRREGDYWLVVFQDCSVRVRDLKGMRYLARLLAEAGREFHVLDLVAAEADPGVERNSRGANARASFEFGDAGEFLDSQARNSYRKRLAEIDEDLEQARSDGDSERTTQAELEREFLLRELSRAVGLGGRSRRAGAASERARAAVTRAIRHSLTRIGEHHPKLGEHLAHSIRTGTYCSYRPDPRAPIAWDSPPTEQRG